MQNPTTLLLEAAQNIAHEAAAIFVAGGGRVLIDGDELTPEQVASPDGALGPLLLWAGDFTRGQGVRFASSRFVRDERALAGYRAEGIEMAAQSADETAKDTSAETILAFSHFLRKVCFDLDHHPEVDLTPVCESFRAWCETNVVDQAISPEASQNRTPD
jgi:hypothetical protein